MSENVFDMKKEAKEIEIDPGEIKNADYEEPDISLETLYGRHSPLVIYKHFVFQKEVILNYINK